MSMDAGKNRKRGQEDRLSAADRRWTVLLIGDHGRVIAFKRIKALIWLTLGALSAALAVGVVLVIVNQGLQTEMRVLRGQLEASQQQIQALRQERDLLTAHVVLVETKMKETLGEGGNRPPSDQKPEPSAPGKRPDRSGTPAKDLGVDEPAAPAADLKPPTGLGESVAVEMFHAGWDGARKAIDLRYQLVATRPGRRPLAGHVIVVFKSDDLEPERWLAMPRVDLPKGRPSGRQRGFSFSISHSKAFAHSMPAPTPLPAFTQAVLYVFSSDGQLLMAKEYRIELQPPGG
jgi:alkylated DNA nucleotide flippase Atl1